MQPQASILDKNPGPHVHFTLNVDYFEAVRCEGGIDQFIAACITVCKGDSEKVHG